MKPNSTISGSMNYVQKFPQSFFLLKQEGYLVSSCLTAGLTALRTAHIHNKGAYYSAFFNLSVGIERLLKIIVIVNYMLINNFSVPTKHQIKGYGHNIFELYDACVKISVTNYVHLPDRGALNNINQEILGFFNNFALTTRYHNLDALGSSHDDDDPLTHWNRIIISILQQDVTPKKLENISKQANEVSSVISDISSTLMFGLNKHPLSTLEALRLPKFHNQAAKHAVLRLITILSPVRDLISNLSDQPQSLGISEPPFPRMNDFLMWLPTLPTDRQYVLRKKRWP